MRVLTHTWEEGLAMCGKHCWLEVLTAMSLTMTAHLRSCLFCRMCWSNVVFPAG